jgi:hypothetical protein
MKTNLLKKILLYVGLIMMAALFTSAGWPYLNADDIRERMLAVPLYIMGDVFRLNLAHPSRDEALWATLGSIAIYFFEGILVWEFVKNRLGFRESS